MVQEGASTSFAALDGQQRKQAMVRFAVLRPYLEMEVSLDARRRRGWRPYPDGGAGWHATARAAWPA